MIKAVPSRKVTLTQEMIDLFRRGTELQAAGHGDDNSVGHDEFVAIAKRLEWELIGLPPHCVSVLDPDIDGEPSSYLTPQHAMYQDWELVRAWRRALQQAVDENKDDQA
jgi:hypothetical protein